MLNRIAVDKFTMKNRPSGPASGIELPPPGETSVRFLWRPVPEHLANLLGIGEPLTAGDPPLSQTGQLPCPLSQTSLRKALTSMDADLSTYPILIPPASNTFHFCHHPQPHHSQPYHAQSIIYHPSFMINGNSRYRAYSTIVSIFPIFSRLPSPFCPPLNSVK